MTDRPVWPSPHLLRVKTNVADPPLPELIATDLYAAADAWESAQAEAKKLRAALLEIANRPGTQPAVVKIASDALGSDVVTEMTPLAQAIPQRPQRQDALSHQLGDLEFVAKRLGMYDAADWVRRARESHS